MLISVMSYQVRATPMEIVDAPDLFEYKNGAMPSASMALTISSAVSIGAGQARGITPIYQKPLTVNVRRADSLTVAVRESSAQFSAQATPTSVGDEFRQRFQLV